MSSQDPVERRCGPDVASAAIAQLRLLDRHPTLRTLLERRTIRAYADRAVEPALIDADRKSTRLNTSHIQKSRMPSSA